MKPSSPQLVWYVSYASNLRRDRFNAYIHGGTAPGSRFINPGCPDPTPPRADRALEIPHHLYFADQSFYWEGAVAFITPTPGRHSTKGRAYLITLDQFRSIIHQENCRPGLANIPPLADIRRRCHIQLGQLGHDGMCDYSLLVYNGELEGHPLLTFTRSKLPESHGIPSAPYLQTIAIGLRESHHLSDTAIAEYLATSPGIRDHYSIPQLKTIFTQSSTDAKPVAAPLTNIL